MTENTQVSENLCLKERQTKVEFILATTIILANFPLKHNVATTLLIVESPSQR